MGAWPEQKVRWVVLAGAMALVTGCASGGMACSAVGCSSGLSVLGPSTVKQQRVKWVRACLGDSCQTKGVGAANGTGFLGRTSADTAAVHTSGPVTVSITLETAARVKLMAAHGAIRFRKVAPNGVKCGPVCYEATVTVHPDGTLTATPVPG
jgi:hypothetical protein